MEFVRVAVFCANVCRNNFSKFVMTTKFTREKRKNMQTIPFYWTELRLTSLYHKYLPRNVCSVLYQRTIKVALVDWQLFDTIYIRHSMACVRGFIFLFFAMYLATTCTIHIERKLFTCTHRKMIVATMMTTTAANVDVIIFIEFSFLALTSILPVPLVLTALVVAIYVSFFFGVGRHNVYIVICNCCVACRHV